MSRWMHRAGDVACLAFTFTLSACGGSSELGDIFGAGGAGGKGCAIGSCGASGGGAGGSHEPKDAATNGGTSGAGGSAGGGGSSGPPADASPDTRGIEDAGVSDATSRPDAIGNDARAGSDAAGRDAGFDAIADARGDCTPTNGGIEVCDGIDNDCNGRVDERQACPVGCFGAIYAAHGYMLCHAPMARRGWQAATTSCASSGMHLVRVDEPAENRWIRMMALAVNYSGAIWLGGSDMMTERRWAWTDGTPFWSGGPNGVPIDNRYSSWDMGQPDNGNRNADCALMRDGGETWRDANCFTRHAYLCEE